MENQASPLSPIQAGFLREFLGVAILDKPATVSSEIAALLAALTKHEPRAAEVIRSNPDRADDINQLIEGVRHALDAGTAAEAKDKLFSLGAMLASLEGRASELDELAARAPAAMAIAAINWRSAAATVATQIRSIGKAMAEEIDDPAVAAEAGKLDKLAELVENRCSSLADAVDDLIDNSDPIQQKPLADTAVAAARELDAFLRGNTLLEHLLSNPLDGGDDPEYDALLLKPLASVEAALATTAAAAS